MDQEPLEQPTGQNLIEKYRENGLLLLGKSNVFGIRDYLVDGELGERIDLEHTKLIRTEVDPKKHLLKLSGGNRFINLGENMHVELQFTDRDIVDQTLASLQMAWEEKEKAHQEYMQLSATGENTLDPISVEKMKKEQNLQDNFGFSRVVDDGKKIPLFARSASWNFHESARYISYASGREEEHSTDYADLSFKSSFAINHGLQFKVASHAVPTRYGEIETPPYLILALSEKQKIDTGTDQVPVVIEGMLEINKQMMEELKRGLTKLTESFTPQSQPKKSIDEFLRRATTERKPLSEEEKKEVMEVAREVWKKVMEKAGGKNYASLWQKTPDAQKHIALYMDEKVAMHKPENPNTDLVIMISEEVKGEKGKMTPTKIIHKYFFAPDEVTKSTFDLTGTKNINFGKLDINIAVAREGKLQDVKAHAQMSDPNLIRKQAERQLEQRTEETYHPDKADLTNLLLSLSSAINPYAK